MALTLAVTSDDGSASAVLSAAGRAKLRALLAEQTRPSGDAGRVRALSPSRHISRRSLAEQLALRRDARGQPLLEHAHVTAAERFSTDFLASALQPRVTQRWEDASGQSRRRGAPGQGVELAAAVVSAQVRVRAALASLGSTSADLVLDVCGFEKTLETIEAERGWPRRSGRIMLKSALEQLALHYGFIEPPRGGPSVTLPWGDGAHRPTVTIQPE